MIVPQGKTEFDPMKSKIYSLDDFPNEKKSKNFGLIFLIILVILLFVLLYFSISINNKTTTDLKNQLQQKDLEIEKIKKQLEDLTQSQNSQQKEKQVEKRQIEEEGKN